MNGGGLPSNLPILDGKNWERRSVSMRSLLGAQEVFEIVQDDYEQLGANPTERQQTTFKDCKKRDCKTLFYIQQSVDSNKFERISKASTSKEAWEILVKYYTGGEKAKKVKLQMLRRQYELLQMEEDEVVADYFNRVQVVVNQMRTNGESLTEVVIIEKILRTLTQRYNHIMVAIEESKDLDKMKVEDLQGSLEAHELRVQREDDEAQIAAEDSDSDEVLLMATTKSDDDCLEQWYLDTGCSNHMTGHKEWFVSIDDKNNLLSLGQLLEKGYSIKMEQGEMRLFDDPRRLILKAPLYKNITFKIDIQINESKCLAAEVMNEDWL
ncbi:uncharacterized protein [Cicer arietinum]|uniref:uncharacterized protein n=1 Tax=Cicer arietinum TaxID=3827 RepID=UPI003CC52701